MSWLMSFARKSAFLRVLSAPVFLALGLVTVGVLSGHEAPITIVTQPADQIASPGKTATFTVVATSHGRTLSYQWFCRNPGHHNRGHFVPIPSATSPSYTTPVLSLSDNGLEYFVRVSSGREKAESRHARLTVKPTITIVTQPADQVASPGQAATFTVAAITDTGTLHYQWFYRHPGHHHRGHDVPIPGANAPSYTTHVLNLGDNGSEYFVYVTECGARAESRHALLTVIAVAPPIKPVVNLDSYVTTGKAGLVASTQDQGTGMTYVWTLTGGTIASGQGTPAIRFTAGAAGTLLKASVRVSNITGSSSGSASATVVAAPNAELALPISVHPGDGWMKASVPIQSGMTYLWTVIPGTSTGSITSGQGTGVIKFSAGTTLGTFQIQSDVQNQAGDHVTANRTVTVQTGTWLVKNGGSMVVGTGATATLLPSGRVLVAGGSGGPDGWAACAEIYDPATGTWTTTGSMGTGRESHTATLLQNGKVLVVGGSGNVSSELYDPATGTWTATGNLGTMHSRHTATLLPDGTVLVAGGGGASVEIYDPAKGIWTPTGNLGTARESHTATLLPNGKVMVAGGYGAAAVSAEIYDPANGTWTPTANLGTARIGHSATLLPDGAVLVVGGSGDVSAELYHPATGTWTPTGSLVVGRYSNTATLLQNGKVLVVGGSSDVSTELYDPATGTWTATASLGTMRSQHAATLLMDGTVLVVGGHGGVFVSVGSLAYAPIASTEIYDPAKGIWTPMGSLGTARESHTATTLPNGTVLVVGGYGPTGNLTAVDIYDPTKETWTATGDLGTARSRHTATLLANGTVLVAGGWASGSLASAEIYNPTTGTWTATGDLGTARYGHTATLLPNGTVLVAGGWTSRSLANAEIYDPATGIWTATDNMETARSYHTATLLPNGTVLVAGGASTNNTEVYDPATGMWTATGSLGTARSSHTATLLPDGTVLVAGGNWLYEGTTPSAEIYDPKKGTWTATASLAMRRRSHTATLLTDGTVLVVGGDRASDAASNDIAIAEIFDPMKGTWTTTESLGAARTRHTATALNNGTVMVAFGNRGDVVTEIYKPSAEIPIGVPAAVHIISGAEQSAIIGRTLPGPVTVLVVDQFGNPIPGVRVVFSAQNGGNVSPGTVSTDAEGKVSTTWTLGVQVGWQFLLVSVAPLPSMLVSASATERGPSTIAITGGDHQTVTQYSFLAEPLTVRVDDSSDMPVEGVSVEFFPSPGYGSIYRYYEQSSVTFTDYMGTTTWEGLFRSSGEQRVTARVLGIPPVEFVLNVVPVPAGFPFDGVYGISGSFNDAPGREIRRDLNIQHGVYVPLNIFPPEEQSQMILEATVDSTTGITYILQRASIDIRYVYTGTFVIQPDGKVTGSGLLQEIFQESPTGRTGTWFAQRL